MRSIYKGVSRSFRTGRLQRELQTVQLCATRCSCIAVVCVSLVSFAAIALCDASHRVFIVAAVYFIIDSVQKLLDAPWYVQQTCVRSVVFCFGKNWSNSLRTA